MIHRGEGWCKNTEVAQRRESVQRRSALSSSRRGGSVAQMQRAFPRPTLARASVYRRIVFCVSCRLSRKSGTFYIIETFIQMFARQIQVFSLWSSYRKVFRRAGRQSLLRFYTIHPLLQIFGRRGPTSIGSDTRVKNK